MKSSALLDEMELFSHVLRETADGETRAVWLPLNRGDRDWERFPIVSRDSINVGTLHVISAALDTIREQVPGGWLSTILGRWRHRHDDDPRFIPNGATGTRVGKRRRDAVLVVATDDTEVTEELLKRHWPVAERFEQIGRNLWIVLGVVVSPDGKSFSPTTSAEVIGTADATSRAKPTMTTSTTTSHPVAPATQPDSDSTLPNAEAPLDRPLVILPGAAQQSPESQQDSQAEVAPSRVVRVFVSSTFRDMQAERDELVLRVFPQLRKLCDERSVVFTDVDLRWGITEEQSAEGQVLPICLAEIDRCRPFFIGLLGNRYGWVPESFPPELLKEQSWLAEVQDKKKSVTELEILHGVLNNPDMSNRACFYFRDPSSTVAADVEGVTDDREKLDALKQLIRNSKLAVRENYADAEAVGQMILADLTRVINQEFPPGSQPTALQRQAAEHESFARSRTVRQVGERQVGCYIGRQEYFDRIDAHVSADGPPLVVLGESGMGKSALLANWAERYRQSHPGDQVLLHFVGATADSADWAAMLRRILGELQRRFGSELEIPDNADALRAAFANALHMTAARGRLVLVIDALNQLDDRDGAPDLVWLPPGIPQNVRLIVSTLAGRPLVDLEKRAWPMLKIEPLTADERRRLICEYFSQYAKQLSDERIERIVGCRQAANPLFLRALLEELRVFGTYEQLDERIDYYLDAATVGDLYERILQRWEDDYERDRPGLVREAMSLLWAARRGLSEMELLDRLGENGQPLPRAHWSPLLLAAEQSLTSRGGLIGFFHDYLRQAVRDRYLASESDRRRAHLRLADCFASDHTDPRSIEELPWQLCEARSWQRLSELLADLPFFAVLWKAGQFDLKAYWSQIEADSPLRMVDTYRPVLDDPAQSEGSICHSISTLLLDTGHPTESLQLFEYLVKHYRETADHNNLPASLSGQAAILRACGDLDGAMTLHKEAEQICRELGNKYGLQAILGSQAMILHTRGDLDGAMTLHKEAEQICRELGNKDALSNSLCNQALILYARGDMDGAMTLYKQQERICRELGNKQGLSISLASQANILYVRGDLDGAMTLYKQHEQTCRELGNKQGLSNSLGGQALILHACGDLDGAMTLQKQEEQICRELGDKDGLQGTLGNQANILLARGDLDGAMTLQKQNEQICRELGNKDALSNSLCNQALILHASGDLDGAMTLHKQQERICRELGNKKGLHHTLGNQAVILNARGDLDGAMTLHKQEEQICRVLEDKNGLQRTLCNQGAILIVRGDLDGAMTLHKEAEQICRELGNVNGLASSLVNQAAVLKQMNEFDAAVLRAEESYNIATQHGLTALAEQIKPILNQVRQASGKG